MNAMRAGDGMPTSAFNHAKAHIHVIRAIVEDVRLEIHTILHPAQHDMRIRRMLGAEAGQFLGRSYSDRINILKLPKTLRDFDNGIANILATGGAGVEEKVPGICTQLKRFGSYANSFPRGTAPAASLQTWSDDHFLRQLIELDAFLGNIEAMLNDPLREERRR